MKGYCMICESEIEVSMRCSSFDCGCMGKPVDPTICSSACYDIWEAESKALSAALEYERNCISKYDQPFNRPSLPPKKGESMQDYADKYGTTIKEMKLQSRKLDQILKSKDNNFII